MHPSLLDFLDLILHINYNGSIQVECWEDKKSFCFLVLELMNEQ